MIINYNNNKIYIINNNKHCETKLEQAVKEREVIGRAHILKLNDREHILQGKQSVSVLWNTENPFYIKECEGLRKDRNTLTKSYSNNNK